MNVMVVESNADHRKTMLTVLAQYGQEGVGFDNQDDAFDYAALARPELIICNGMVSELSWKLSFRLSQIPNYRPYIVALASVTSMRDKCLCQEHGFDEYLSKPISLNDFLGLIDSASNKRESNITCDELEKMYSL